MNILQIIEIFPSISESSPSSRSKHAGCVQSSTGDVFILAGRNGNVALRDFWRYQPGEPGHLDGGGGGGLGGGGVGGGNDDDDDWRRALVCPDTAGINPQFPRTTDDK